MRRWHRCCLCQRTRDPKAFAPDAICCIDCLKAWDAYREKCLHDLGLEQ